MISCSQARHLFDAFLDGELSSGLRTELHAHRLSCPECSQELALLEACADVVATDRREPVLHTDFTDRVMIAFASRKPAPTYRWRRVAVIVGSPMAAAAVLVFALMAWFQPTTGQRVVMSREEKAPIEVTEAYAPDVIGRMTKAEREAFDKTEAIPASKILASMLQPAVDRVDSALAETRRSASELANLVQFGIGFTQQSLYAGLKNEGRSGDPIDSIESPAEQSVLPWFDMPGSGTEHFDRPASTEAETKIEVM